MVWGGISENSKTPLVILDGHIIARRYTDEVLRPIVQQYMSSHSDVTVFLQDNARLHAARFTQEFLCQSGLHVMQWPPYSPDLSLIEHLWDILKKAVAKRQPQPRSRSQLAGIVKEEWNRIPQATISNLIQSMRRRCVACISAKGGHTRY